MNNRAIFAILDFQQVLFHTQLQFKNFLGFKISNSSSNQLSKKSSFQQKFIHKLTNDNHKPTTFFS